MTDRLTQSRRSVNMSAIRSRNTYPEIAVRRIAHQMGYRFRLNCKDLPGKPDLVFRSRKKVIFVHGCFWHQHDAPGCSDSRLPKSNKSYWHNKLKRNAERDQQHIEELRKLGWKSLVLWECQIGRELPRVSKRISTFLG